LKILIQNRRDHDIVNGGDKIQIEKTVNALKRKYPEIIIDFSCEFNFDLSKYDIVHLFNVTRVHETYQYFLNAKKQNKPVALTPIYHSITGLELYENNGRRGLLGYVNKVFKSADNRELIKNMLRLLVQNDLKQIYPVMAQKHLGYYEQQKYVLENSDIIFPIAYEEILCARKELNIIKHLNCIVTPNGVLDDLSGNVILDSQQESDFDKFDFKKLCVCIGRIENRKNQVSLINALKDTEFGVIFVGSPNPKNKYYFSEFIKCIDNKKFFYLGSLDHQKVFQLLKRAEVSVLPSWFEVTSLVDFEAYFAKCKIVTTKYSYIKDYIKNNIFYCDPLDVSSIKMAVEKAFEAKTESFDSFSHLTWDNTAEKVYAGYQSLLT